MLQTDKKIILSSNNTRRTFYWNNLNYFFRSYKLSNSNVNFFLKPKVKSYKRLVNKSKLSRSMKVVKLHLPFQLFTSSPPLSTTLNALGIPAAKFIDEFNIYFSKIFENNNRVILKIVFHRNLSYSLHCTLNETALIKNLNGLSLFNVHSFGYLNSFLKTKSFSDFLNAWKNNSVSFHRFDDQIFNNRLFTFHDIFILTNYLFIYKQYINSMNWSVNQKLSEMPSKLTDEFVLLNFESVLHSILGTIRSFQNQNFEDLNFFKTIKYKIATKA
jgi:hypothetical protein